MISRLFTKTVAGAIALSLFASGVAFVSPTPAKAEIMTCAARAASALGLIGANQAAHVAVVPVGDVPNKAAFTTSATSNFGSFFGDCVLKPIAIRLANAMLHNITYSIVNWINNGFHGNPSFVEDLNGLLQDSTDEAIGEFISSDLGAGFLCSPFSFQVRIAIAQSYLPYRQRAACTLSQIENNVDGFVRGDNLGGWQNWLDVTTVPQNNVYGATILAQNELSRKITEKLGVENRVLDWGKGFRSWQECVEPETQAEADARAGITTTDVSYASYRAQQSAGPLRSGSSYASSLPTYSGTAPSPVTHATPGCKRYETRTPGTVVEGQLVQALGSDMRRLEVANDIDAIIGALTNQLMSQVINGAKGLLGAGRNSSGGYSSTNYADALNANIDDPNLAQAIDSGTSQLGEGLDLESLTSLSIDVSTSTQATTTEDTTGVPQNEAPMIDWRVIRNTPVVSATTPLNVEIDLVANHPESHLGVKMDLKDSQGRAVPFMSALTNPRLSYGRSDGSIAFRDITDVNNASVEWVDVSVSKNAVYKFSLMGDRKAGTYGTYVVTMTLTDSEGELVKTQTATFTLQ